MLGLSSLLALLNLLNYHTQKKKEREKKLEQMQSYFRIHKTGHCYSLAPLGKQLSFSAKNEKTKQMHRFHFRKIQRGQEYKGINTKHFTESSH